MKTKAFSTFERRIGWLLRHHAFLVGKVHKKKIVTAMKHDGLVSKKTYWLDVKLDKEIRQAKIMWFASHNRVRSSCIRPSLGRNSRWKNERTV